MATKAKPFTFSSGATIIASEHNSNFDTIYDEFNGNIDNANIKANAAIAGSKIDLSTIGAIGGSSPSGATFTNLVATTSFSTVTTSFIVAKTVPQNNMATGGVTITWDDEISDVGDNFASNTFTAPTTRKYLMTVIISLENIDVDSTSINVIIVTSNRNYAVHLSQPNRQLSADSAMIVSGSIIADMDASDTATISYGQTAGDTQTNAIVGCFFTGSAI